MKKLAYILFFLLYGFFAQAQCNKELRPYSHWSFLKGQSFSNDPYFYIYGYSFQNEPRQPEVEKHQILSIEATEFQIKKKKETEPQILHQLRFNNDALPTETIFYEEDFDLDGNYKQKIKTTFLYSGTLLKQLIEITYNRKDSSIYENNYYYTDDNRVSQHSNKSESTYFDEQTKTLSLLTSQITHANFVYRNDTVEQIIGTFQDENRETKILYDTLWPNAPFDYLYVFPKDTINKVVLDSLGRISELYKYEPENLNAYRNGIHGPYKLAYILKYEYNENNQMINIKKYNKKNKLLIHRTYLYNEKGLLAETYSKVYGKESIIRYTYTYH